MNRLLLSLLFAVGAYAQPFPPSTTPFVRSVLVSTNAADFRNRIDAASSADSGEFKIAITNGAAVNLTGVHDWVNAKNSAYGAIGDNDNDDTVELQAALTAGVNNTVILPKGTYKVSDPITMATNTTLLAYGAKIINTSAAETILQVNTGCKVLGLEIEGSGNGSYDDLGRAIAITGVVGTYKSDILIQDCFIHDVAGYGIRADFAERVRVIGGRVEDIGYAGIMGLSVTDMTIDGAHVKNLTPGTAGNAYGISLTRTSSSTNLATFPRSKNSKIINCTVENNTLWEGIDTHAGEEILIQGNTLKNCKTGIAVVRSALVAGTDGHAPRNVRVIGNHIEGIATAPGISVTGATGVLGTPLEYAPGIVIQGNTLYNCGEAGNTLSGAIYLTDTKGAIVSGNYLRASLVAGINFYTDNKDFSATGNTIIDVWDNTVTVPGGIVLRSSYNYGTVSGNTLLREDTALGTYVSVRGISTVDPANAALTIGPNRNTFTDQYVGIFPATQNISGDSTAALLKVDTANSNVSIGTANTSYKLSLRSDASSIQNLLIAQNETAGGAANIQVRANTATGGFRAWSDTFSEAHLQDKVGIRLDSNPSALALVADGAATQTIDFYAGGTTRSGYFTNGTLFATTEISAPLLTLTGTGTLNGLDAIDSTTETTLESALDIAGEVSSTGMGSTVIADSVSVTGWSLGASTATTPAENDNDTSVATTAYVQTEIAGLGSAANWTADGTTNSTLPGIAYVHQIVATNGITTQGGAFTIVAEGATDDDFETTITVADTTSSDKTITFPDSTGTVILSGHTFTGDATATVDSDGSTALTIADSVTVTGWALGASTATTPAENDNDTSVATTAYVQTEISGLGGATSWENIGDAGGDATTALGAHETDFTSTIDASGEAIFTFTNTDADAANDNSFIDLRHNDGADANVFYMRFIGDNDGTPSNDYLFSQTAFTTASGVAVSVGGTASIGGVLTQTGNIELNHASQNTLSASSGDLSIEGVVLAKRTGGNTLGGTQLLSEGASIGLDAAGSADGAFTGITRTGTAGAALAFGDLIYLDPTDSRWELADANSASAADGDARGILGICVQAAAADGSATTILISGIVRADTAFPSFTINAPIYVSETAGDLTNTSPTTEDNVVRIVGAALTADEIHFNPSYTWVVYDAP